MKTSEIITDIAIALANAQNEIEPALKDAVNPHFRSKYATLAACKYAAKAALGKFGLAVIQSIETDIERQYVSVITRITHKSGQWFESETACKPKSMGPQDIGSCATYLRRYSYSAMIGLVSEDDDDGNSQSIANSNKSSIDEFEIAKNKVILALNDLSDETVQKIFNNNRQIMASFIKTTAAANKALAMIKAHDGAI